MSNGIKRSLEPRAMEPKLAWMLVGLGMFAMLALFADPIPSIRQFYIMQ